MFRDPEGELFDDRALHLAMLGEVLCSGWQSIDTLDPERGPARRENLDWWIGRAREYLDLLG